MAIERNKLRVEEIRALDAAELRRLVDFALDLRESDLREVLGASGTSAAGMAAHLKQETEAALAAGGRVWTVQQEGRWLAAFGAQPDSLTAESAAIWMLAVEEVERYPVELARWSRRGLGLVVAEFPQVAVFYNWVPAGAARTRRWLYWLGAHFEAQPGYASPWTGERYERFVIETEAGNV